MFGQVFGGFLGVAIDHRKRDLAAVWHGVSRVGGEVDEDLFECCAVEIYKDRVFREVQVESNVFGDEASEDFLHVTSDLDRVEHLRF